MDLFETLNHFFSVVFLTFIATVALVSAILGRFDRLLLALFAVSISLAGLSWWRQTRVLQFKKFHTDRDAEVNFQAVLSMAQRKGWHVMRKRRNVSIVAAVQGFPRSWRSWGERVTVRFHGRDVWINSICDPSQQTSMTAWGRNSENVNSVMDAVGATSGGAGLSGETGVM